jgi:hypothetical protein
METEMLTFFLAVHNIMRWVVLFTTIAAIVLAYSGWFGKRAWLPAGKRWSNIAVIALDVQLLLGLILYFFLSPVGMRAFQQFGMSGVMGTTEIRFFAVEHILMMVIAVIVAHVGSAFAKRATTDSARYRSIAISLTVSLLLILASIPWNRPLFPGIF